MFVWASGLRPAAPSYVTKDEAFWFENIREISSNQFGIGCFPGVGDGVFRCYLDLTLGQDHMNLRQALLLYDEIWCSLPLAGSQGAFLAKQGLTETDLLDMVDAGRLRFVTTQPEERLNVPFLEAVFEHDSDAVFGRRTTAALLVADVAEIAESSFLSDPSIVPDLRLLAEELSSHVGVAPRELLRSYLWPQASRRGSLQGLIERGSKGGPALELAEVIAASARSQVGVDVQLEALLFSEAVHLGHALNATILGPLDEPASHHLLKSAVGRHLNFHRHFNPKFFRSWIENELRGASGSRPLPPLPLLEFEKDLPIQEILADSRLGSTRAKGRTLYSRLAELPPEERQQEIEELISALRRRARRAGILVDLDSSLAFASIFLEFFFPPLALLRVGSAFLGNLRRIRQIDQAILQMETALSRFGKSQDLDFLSSVSRVARFRRERV